MKKNNIPGNATPAPANKAENTKNHTTRDLRKEAEARSRARRMRSMLKLGMKEELIEEMFADENNRMILVLLSGNYTIQDGTRKIKHYKRDSSHKVVKVTEEEIPNILRGSNAAMKYIEENKLHFMAGNKNAIWILTDKDNVDEVVEKLNILGRTSVTKPEKHTYDTEKAHIAKEKKTPKKPTNNTVEVHKAAKAKRKANNIKRAEMRPYYAALRKGGVSERIKKYNKTLADKIEKWLKEKKTAEASRKKGSKEERAQHRQLTSLEMKANKRARKAAKHLATQERCKKREMKRTESNAAERAKRTQKAQKPTQTELKMAALL